MKIFLVYFKIVLMLSLSSGIALKVLVGIDYGTEYIKIGVFKPGRQIEIALNSEARRKISAAVAFRNNERLIGESALSMATKHPDMTFLHTSLLLGRQLNSTIVKQYLERYSHHRIVTGADGTLEFVLQNQHRVSVEQLSAMLLEAAMETVQTFLTESSSPSMVAKNHFKDELEVGITTPPFWGQSERQALLRAAEYAGIKSVRLVNSNAAVAFNFGLGVRSSLGPAPQWYSFFDMGAVSMVATVASYQKAPVSSGNKKQQLCLLRIRGVGYHADLGAIDFIDRIIQDSNVSVAKNTTRVVSNALNITTRSKKIGKQLDNNASRVANDAISVAKARLAAGRLFRVLSANRRSGSLTRDRLRSLVADLLDRLRRPVKEAMTSSPKNIRNDLLLMGGGSRCPLVQEELMKITGSSRLGRNINTDEAAALGAVQYLVAMEENRIRMRNESRNSGGGGGGFARRKLGTTSMLLVDFNLFPVAAFSNVTDSKLKRHAVFNYGDPIPDKKTIVFLETDNKVAAELLKGHGDFYIALEHHNLKHLSKFQRSTLGGPLLVKYSTKGFSQIIKKYSDFSTHSRRLRIEALFRHDSSGIVWLDKLDLIVAETENGSTISEAIKFEPIEFGHAMPSLGQRQHARDVVLEFRRRELEARAAAKWRNDLEAAVIEARTRLIGDSSSGSGNHGNSGSSADLPIYVRCSNPKEHRELLAALARAESVLATSSSINGTRLQTELNRFNAAFTPVASRATELMKRPAALASLDAVLKLAKSKISRSEKNGKLMAEIGRVQKWLTAAEAKLARADVSKDPPISIGQIDKQRVGLEKLVSGKRINRNSKSEKQKYLNRRLSDELEDGDEDKTSKAHRPERGVYTPAKDEAESNDEDNDEDDVDRDGNGLEDFHGPDGEL